MIRFFVIAWLFLKTITTDGKTEYFNIRNILNVEPNGENTKILMGAGLYWKVKTDSIEIVTVGDIINKTT